MLKQTSVAALLISVASTVGFWSPSAQATIFGFDDEIYLASTTRPSTSIQTWAVNEFGTSNGVGSPGTYQGNNGKSSTQLQRVGGSSVAISGEWALSNGQFTNQFLSLIGWGQSLNVGQTVDTVYNVGDPHNGAVLYFQYMVGGTKTPFTLNGFDLHAATPSATITLVLGGFLNGIEIDSAPLTVTGNSFHTDTLNWQGVDTVEVVSWSSVGTGQLYMDNVEINDPVPTVPEPASLTLLGMSLAGLCFARRRKATIA